MRTAVVVVAVVIVAAFSLLIFLRVNRVSGQMTDVSGLVTDQAATANRILGAQTAAAEALLAQIALVERLEATQRAVRRTTERLYREVHRVLRRFQLLFRRLLRGLRGRLPAQTAALVTSVERGLRQLLSRLKRR